MNALRRIWHWLIGAAYRPERRYLRGPAIARNRTRNEENAHG